MKEDSRPITWRDIRLSIPMLGAVATLIFFLATISLKVDDLQNSQSQDRQQLQHLSDNADLLRTTVTGEGTDIAVIKQILQHNNLSDSGTTSSDLAALPIDTVTPQATSATMNPTPAPTPVPAVNNPSENRVIIESAPTPVPPTPSPTSAPTPVKILCVATICI